MDSSLISFLFFITKTIMIWFLVCYNIIPIFIYWALNFFQYEWKSISQVESSEAGDRAWAAKSTENLQKIKQVKLRSQQTQECVCCGEREGCSNNVYLKQNSYLLNFTCHHHYNTACSDALLLQAKTVTIAYNIVSNPSQVTDCISHREI